MRDVIITLIVFGTLPFVLKRPHIGVLLFSWISYMNPHRLSWGFAYNFPFAAISAIFVFIGLFVSKENKKFPITSVTILWLLFILWTCITTYFALIPDDAIMEWKRTIKIQVMVFVTLLIMNTKDRIIQLIWVIVGSFAFFGVKGGIFTLATGGNYRVWGPPGSFVEGNNEIALALIMILPLMRFLHLQTGNKWIKHALVIAMIFCVFSILSSYSRGAFIAGGAMAIFLWYKGNRKIVNGVVIVILIAVSLSFMPQKWFERMDTISTYEEDDSAMGRVNAWWFAYNLASDRPITGGGFQTFDPELFYIYAPIPDDFHDAHSIYFEVLGEQGYVGLFLFLLMWIVTFRTASRVIKQSRNHNDLLWARDLAAMLQVSLIGYAVGGSFLGLAYFDLPYHLMAIIVLLKIITDEAIKRCESVQNETSSQAL